MKLIRTVEYDDNQPNGCPIIESTLAQVSPSLTTSRRAMLCMLQTHACRQFGIEGRDFRIAQSDKFPFMYAKGIGTFGTQRIEFSVE